MNLDDPRQPYKQVADDIRQAIAAGRLTPGDRLDSIRCLARRYGVAGTTVQRALRELRDEGYVAAWQGRGVYVVSDRPAPPADPLASILARLDALEAEVRTLRRRVTGR